MAPLDYTRWTPPQDAYLQSQAQNTLLRTGNQLGKTWVGAAEVIFRCLGRHPHKDVRAGPIEAWVLCSSWSQSIAIQQKIWALLPKDQLTEDTQYAPKSGFRGVQKAVVFRNGSILRVKTSGQDTLDLESATIHYVWIDEPIVDAGTFTALQMRLRRTGGQIGITMTPATTGDLQWLRELVGKGRVLDLHFRMEASNFVPRGASRALCTEDGELMDQRWIDQQMVKLSVGIDYGEERLRTCAVLVAVDDTTVPDEPRVYVLGEYAPDTASTLQMDATSVLGMVAAAGFRWHELDYAWGDKRYTDAKGRITRKSNSMLTTRIAAEMGKRHGIRPAFRGAKKGIGGGRGAVWAGVRWLNDRQITPGCFYVDRRCRWLVECMQKWDGTDRSRHKDAIDALRYALRPWIYPRRRATVRPVRFG